MGAMSVWHWLIVLAVVLLLFGRGRIADIMGEFGKGLTSFKKGMGDAEKRLPEPDPVVAGTEVKPQVHADGEPRQG